MKKKLGK